MKLWTRIIFLFVFLFLTFLIYEGALWYNKAPLVHIWDWLFLLGLLASLALALQGYATIYINDYDEVIPKKLRYALLTVFPVFSIIVIFMNLLIIGDEERFPDHILLLEAYFFVFILWDMLIYKYSKKENGVDLYNGLRNLVREWFIYIDLPSALGIGILYMIVSNCDDALVQCDHNHNVTLILMAGVIGFHMFMLSNHLLWDTFLTHRNNAQER